MSDHFTGLPALDGSFSRLVPASRSVAFQFPPQPPNQVSPDLHLSSTDSAPRSTVQHLDTDLGQEMRDVASRYTLCLRRDQELSQSERTLYGVIVDMAREATNENGVTSADTAARVRGIDQFVQNAVANSNVAHQNLTMMTEDARLYRFHAHLGDFSACLCDMLKDGEDSKSLLKAPWTTIVETLDQEDNATAAWKAGEPHEPRTPIGKAIARRVHTLNQLGHNDVDTEIALFAVRTYARRNFIAHGNTFAIQKSGDSAGLALYLDNVDSTLESVLPDDERPQVDKYRRLLNIYRDRKIRHDGTAWVTADQRDYQPKTTSAAKSGPTDDKTPVDKLMDRIQQLQEELCQLDAKTLKEEAKGLMVRLENVKKTIKQGAPKGQRKGARTG